MSPEDRKALDLLYQAAGLAQLTRRQHESIVAAANQLEQSLSSKPQETKPNDPAANR